MKSVSARSLTLWPQLTVREHLRLRLAFSIEESESKRDDDDNGDDDIDPSSESTLIQTLASKLAISNKLDEQVSTLSGGQKRKVSLCCRFKLLDCYSR